MLSKVHPNSLVLSRIVVVLLVATGTVFGNSTGTFPPVPDVDLPILYGFARWDSGYYLEIARNWYGAFPNEKAYAFPPLYPLILRLLYPIFGWLDVRSAELLAGFLWNLVALGLTSVLLQRLTKILLGADAAKRTLLLLAVYPSTIFLSAIYAEATNLLLVVASIYLLETNRILRGGLVGFLAGLTRPETFLLSVPFLVKSLAEKPRARLALASITIFLSLPALSIFSYYGTGNLFAELQVQRAWPSCNLFCLLSNPIFELSKDTLPFAINIAVMALAALFVVRGLTKRETAEKVFPYYVWSFILIAVLFYAGEVRAWARFTLALPPIFWSQADYSLNHPRFFQGISLSYAIMMSLATILFVNWYPFL